MNNNEQKRPINYTGSCGRVHPTGRNEQHGNIKDNSRWTCPEHIQQTWQSILSVMVKEGRLNTETPSNPMSETNSAVTPDSSNPDRIVMPLTHLQLPIRATPLTHLHASERARRVKRTRLAFLRTPYAAFFELQSSSNTI